MSQSQSITTLDPVASPARADTARPRIASGGARTLPVQTGHLIGRYRRSGLFWALGIIAYTLMLVLIFPSFENSSALDVSSYPESMREALNITTLNAIEPYLSSQAFGFFPLALAFFPVTILAGAIAGAEERGALDILLGTPLPRRHLVLASWLAVATVLLLMLVALGAATWLAAVALGLSLSAAEAFGAALNLFPITMAFGSLALLVSARVRQRAVAIGVPVAVLFGMYLIDITGKIASGLDWMRYLSAFRYYGDAIQDGVPWGGSAVLLAAGLVLLLAAIPVFDRRDVFA